MSRTALLAATQTLAVAPAAPAAGAPPSGPSFPPGVGQDGQDRRSDRYRPPALWNGARESGERFPVTSCDDKLIGARYFVKGYGADRLPEGAFLSPRDEVGHGTRVAGIAAGNDEVDPEIAGNDLGVDRITGAAPAAHVAACKACWVTGDCAPSDIAGSPLDTERKFPTVARGDLFHGWHAPGQRAELRDAAVTA